MSGISPERCPSCHRNGVRHHSGIASVMDRCTHRERSPSLYFLPQSDCDPVGALSTNVYRESVFSESDMVSGVVELDLRQE
jgi:hypothetical protein